MSWVSPGREEGHATVSLFTRCVAALLPMGMQAKVLWVPAIPASSLSAHTGGGHSILSHIGAASSESGSGCDAFRLHIQALLWWGMLTHFQGVRLVGHELYSGCLRATCKLHLWPTRKHKGVKLQVLLTQHTVLRNNTTSQRAQELRTKQATTQAWRSWDRLCTGTHTPR